MFNFVVQCIILCGFSLDLDWSQTSDYAREFSTTLTLSLHSPPTAARSAIQPLERLRGDFPEFRPGARAAGRETFWR